MIQKLTDWIGTILSLGIVSSQIQMYYNIVMPSLNREGSIALQTNLKELRVHYTAPFNCSCPKLTGNWLIRPYLYIYGNVPWVVVVGTNGLGLGGGGPFNNFGLARSGGLEGSSGLDPSILELSCAVLSPSGLTLRLLERTVSSLDSALEVAVEAGGEVGLSVATVWLRGFLTSEAFWGVLLLLEAVDWGVAGPFDCVDEWSACVYVCACVCMCVGIQTT